MSELGPASPAAAPGRLRLTAGRLNPFNILDQARPSDLILVLTLAVIGLVVRLVVLDPDTIHGDEALYASYGLHITQGKDWLLIHVGFAIDKIPLFYWAEAIAIRLFGNTPLSIRLVDIAASAATIGAVYVLARDLAGRAAGWAAGLAMALSPFAILFGASVFTDPFAIALGFGALALARRDHAWAAGILIGLSLGGKLFGLAYLPLALVLLLTVDAPRRRRALIAYLVGFAVTTAALLGMMAIRTHVFGAPWFLSTSFEEVGGTGLTDPAEWSSRLLGWWYSGIQYFAESNFLRMIAAFGLAGALIAAVRIRGRLGLAIAAVCAFSPAYLGLLVVARSPLYDRYMFYIVPTLCVAVGIGIAEFLRMVRPSSVRRLLLLALTVVVLARSVPIVAQAEAGAFPVGPRSDYTMTGYRQMCSWLEGRATTPIVVWNQSLSWTLGYCLMGTQAYGYWYPDLATITPGPQTYLALSTLDDPDSTVAALRARGMAVTLVETVEVGVIPHLWVYQLLPAPATPFIR
jgi:4-amino-4-deoxy-L-arabinose transferase-like glycosyltransferase